MEQAKERLAANSQDEVILQLENELVELRNACSIKDQRIAELSRTDTPAVRLKRDIRHLASELHHARKELSESMREIADLKNQLERGEAGDRREISDSPSATNNNAAGTTSGGTNSSAGRAGGDRGSQLRGRIIELEEENRSLRDTVVQLKADSLHQSHARQPSGAGPSTQRAAEPSSQASAAAATGPGGAAGTAAARQGYAALQAPTPGTMASSPGSGTPTSATAMQEEPLRQIVYSSASPELAATIGPTMLQGVGTVEGVHMVAKVLLQRIHSSVCAPHRRQQPMANMGGNVPQMMMAQMPLTG